MLPMTLTARRGWPLLGKIHRVKVHAESQVPEDAGESVLPILGVLIYLIVHGGDMSQRQMDRATEAQEAQDEYFRDVAGSSQADELAKLASLRDKGVLSEDEYQAQKTKLLAP